MGTYLSPRTLITKKNVPLLGTKADMDNRQLLKRVDSLERQKLVKKARKNLFSGKALAGERVQKTLDHESLVPTEVCVRSKCYRL